MITYDSTRKEYNLHHYCTFGLYRVVLFFHDKENLACVDVYRRHNVDIDIPPLFSFEHLNIDKARIFYADTVKSLIDKEKDYFIQFCLYKGIVI